MKSQEDDDERLYVADRRADRQMESGNSLKARFDS